LAQAIVGSIHYEADSPASCLDLSLHMKPANVA
jgi:hypothetical protein